MANWKFWQRKSVQNSSELPEEVQEYYASSRGNPQLRAIFVGLATLVVTLLIAYLLFLAGQFIYNQFSDGDDTTEVTDVTETEELFGDSEIGLEGDQETDPNQPNGLPGSDEAENGAEQNTSDNGASSTQSGQVPDTGPGDTLAIFVVTVLVATLAHNLYQRKRAIN